MRNAALLVVLGCLASMAHAGPAGRPVSAETRQKLSLAAKQRYAAGQIARGADGRFSKPAAAPAATAPHATALEAGPGTAAGRPGLSPLGRGLAGRAAAAAAGAPAAHAEEATRPLAPAEPARRPGLLARLGGWVGRQVTVRSEVRQTLDQARKEAHGGDLSAAANTFTRPGLAPQGLRERLAIRSTRKELVRTTAKQISIRTKSSDLEGGADALSGMSTLEKTGTLGFFERRTAARAEDRAVKNVLVAAKRAGQVSDLDTAAQSLSFASQVAGPADRRVVKGVKRYGKDAWKTAERAASHGDVETFFRAIEHVPSTGSGPELKRLQALKDRAYKRAVPRLLKEASQAYATGQADSAAALIAASMRIQSQEGLKLGFFAARRQDKLVARLGSRVAHAREAQEQADREAQEQALAPDPQAPPL